MALSTQMLMVIAGWQMYGITHSAFDLGLVGLAQFVPALALCFVVGQVADRCDQRRVLMACLVVQASIGGLLISGTIGAWLGRGIILLASFGLGTVRAFQQPAQQALLPTLIPLDVLPRGLALTSGGTQLANILGPAIAGFAFVAGSVVVYSACGGMSVFAIVMIASISAERCRVGREPLTIKSGFAGITFIWHRKEVLGAISLDLFAVLFGGATALLPIFAREVLHVGSSGLGMLRSAPVIGALLVSLYLSRHPVERRIGKIMFGAVAMYGLATMVFALSRNLLLSIGPLALSGAFDMVSVVVRQSLVQLQTPNDMRGRVSAVNSIFIGASNQLGEFESGLTAAWFGAVPSVVIGGAATILTVSLWLRLFPTLARTEKLSLAATVRSGA